MRREDCIEMFKRIPERFHCQVNLVMQNRSVVAVDIVVRFEPTYLVLRGREGGQTEDGRAFFLPFEEISFLRLERTLKLSEVKLMFGESGWVDDEDKLAPQAEAPEHESQDQLAPVESLTPTPTSIPVPVPVPIPMPSDPASIAKQNLLERIRAARANAAAAAGSRVDKK